MRDAERSPRGAGPRTPRSPRVTVDRLEGLQNRNNADQEHEEANIGLERDRQRRLSVQSYSLVVSDSDDSLISNDTDDDIDGANEMNHNQGGDYVPMYMKVDGHFYLVKDTYEESSNENENTGLLEVTVDTFFGDNMV